eukprot:COSAG01_NODE_28798_length_652_cov_1.804702_1_plen_136_part_00
MRARVGVVAATVVTPLAAAVSDVTALVFWILTRLRPASMHSTNTFFLPPPPLLLAAGCWQHISWGSIEAGLSRLTHIAVPPRDPGNMPLLDPCLCCALEAERVPICRGPKKQQPQPQLVHGVPTDTYVMWSSRTR